MPSGTSGKAVSKDAIVSEAVQLMAERGLPAVSLRRIAAALDVSAPTLYWYIASKRELLDSVAEYLLRTASVGVADCPGPRQPWWEWLEERARAIFGVMISVRDAPQVMAGNRPSVDMLPSIDRALGELIAAGFSAGEAQQVFFVLGAYVGGMALEFQAESARSHDDVDDSALHDAITSGRHPHLAAAAEQRAYGTPMATFEYGLGLLIRGLRSRHTELVARENPQQTR